MKSMGLGLWNTIYFVLDMFIASLLCLDQSSLLLNSPENDTSVCSG